MDRHHDGLPWRGQANERIRVVDIFDEVEQDLRAERAERVLKRYGWLLVAAAVAVVGGVAGWQFWQHSLAQRDEAAAAGYIAVQNAVGQGTASAEQIGVLDQLAATAPEGYRTLARLRAAGLKADSGNVAEAVALWNTVAADPKADPLLRDLASLLATGHELDRGDPALLQARIKPLAEPGNPWSALAREQLAMLDLRLGNADAARLALQVMSVGMDTPPGLRARASALLAGLGPQAAK